MERHLHVSYGLMLSSWPSSMFVVVSSVVIGLRLYFYIENSESHIRRTRDILVLRNEPLSKHGRMVVRVPK